MSEIEEEVFSKVLANEATCRLLLKQLETQGVTFSVPIEKITHEECVEAALAILSDLKRHEATR